MSTNTSGNKDRASKSSTAALICGVFGFLCTGVLPLIAILVVLIHADQPGEPNALLIEIVLGAAVILDLLAVILGVISLRSNPPPANRKIAKVGVFLGAIGPILIGLLYIVGYARKG